MSINPNFVGPARSHPMRVLELIDDVIKLIVAYLDNDSLYAFVRAHPRFRVAYQSMENVRIRSTTIDASLRSLVTLSASRIGHLILSNCHADARTLCLLIQLCPNLRELNTVNSGLTNEHLIRCLPILTRLEILSFTALGEQFNGTLPREFRSIERVYVECSHESFTFAVKLINTCPKINWLYVVVLNESSDRERPGTLPPGVPLISLQSWQVLKTVIVVFHQILSGRGEMFNCVFGNRPGSRELSFDTLPRERDAYTYGNGKFILSTDCVKVDTLLLDDSNFQELSREGLPEAGPWRPRRLKVEKTIDFGMSKIYLLRNPLLMFDTLAVLNVGDCPPELRGEHWRAIFGSLHRLETLTIPLCYLVGHSIGRNNTRTQVRARNRYRDDVMEALQGLRLEKLVLKKTCTEESSPDLPPLRLGHLLDLTLVNVPVCKNFWEDTECPSMTSLKVLDLGQRPTARIMESEKFFAKHDNLKYLKLFSRDLAVTSYRLWNILRGSKTKMLSNLKEICLSTRSGDPGDVDVMQRAVHRFSGDVLHIHAPHMRNSGVFREELEEEVRLSNMMRGRRKLHAAFLLEQNGLLLGNFEFPANFPGRRICSFEFSPDAEPAGWGMD